MDTQREQKYLETVLKPIRVCASYKPKLGQGQVAAGLDLVGFQKLYQADRFYSWFGLDNPLMYAAHKAAGGMTSIYRQIGIGCESLFRAVLQDELGLSAEQSQWCYTVTAANGKERKLKLDGRIELTHVTRKEARSRVRAWIDAEASSMGISNEIASALKGVVFEVRQGYKSKDSKRQNADIANAATAYMQAYLPCAVLLSTQIDEDIADRYRGENWAILTGRPVGATALESTYEFMRAVIGYDLAAFFEKHAGTLQREVSIVLEALLKTE